MSTFVFLAVLFFNSNILLAQDVFHDGHEIDFDLLDLENSTEGGVRFSDYSYNPLMYVDRQSDKVVVCHPGQKYDAKLGRCRVLCAMGEIYVESTDTCEPSGKTRPAPTRTCRNLTIPSSEFRVLTGGDLLVLLTGLVVGPGNFSLSANRSSASLCYPFSEAFLACSKWQINAGEFEVRHGGLQIWVADQHRSYQAYEFGLPQGATGPAITCKYVPPPAEVAANQAITDGFAIAWTVSAVSLFVAFIVYFFRMTKLKVHDKMLLSHIASLFVVSILFILRLWGPQPTLSVCMAYGILINFSFLAAFCWINVLAFDIWRKFPSLSNFNDLSRQGNDTLRFIKHSIYAWGIPFLIVLTAVLYDTFQTDEANIFKPSYDQNCWLNVNYSRLLFFYGPVALILTSNFIFFGLTVWKIRRFGQGAERVNKNIHRQLIGLYSKLMIVMGLCWIMEVISWAVGGKQENWYFTDIINALQGFFLFVIYVCKPSVIKSVRGACERMMCCRRKSSTLFYFPSSQYRDPCRRHMSISYQNSNLSDTQPSCTSQLSTVSHTVSSPNSV